MYSQDYIDTLMDRGKVQWKQRKGTKELVKYLSYSCDGDEQHYYSQWVSQIDGDWTEIVTDTLSETLGQLEQILDEPITIGQTSRSSVP